MVEQNVIAAVAVDEVANFLFVIPADDFAPASLSKLTLFFQFPNGINIIIFNTL